MTIIKKAISWAVVVIILFFTIAIIWVRFYGKTFIENRASQICKSQVTVESVHYMFPLGVRLSDVNIAGLLFSPEAQVQLNVAVLWGGAFNLHEVVLTAPVLTLHRQEDHSLSWQSHADSNVKEGVAVAKSAPSEAKNILKSLVVVNGKIFFPGHAEQGTMDLYLQDVQLSAKNIALSGQSSDTVFDISGKVIGENFALSGEVFKGNGMINWPARNMDAEIKVVNSQGKDDLQLKLTSRNNDMMVQGRVTSARLFHVNGDQDPSVGNVLLDAVNGSGMGFEMEFSFPTKMDRWELRNIQFSGNLSPSVEVKPAAE